MGDSANLVNFWWYFIFCLDVMLDISPFFGVYVIQQLFWIAIARDTNESYIWTPLFSILPHHLLIMLHRSLARRTPSSPKINQPHLALLMLKLPDRCRHRCIFSIWLNQPLNSINGLVLFELLRDYQRCFRPFQSKCIIVLLPLGPHMHVQLWEK